MYYYNQNDYSSVPYPYNDNGKTVKTSGCGVCCACIVINSLAGKELYSVKKMAEFSLKNNGRDSSGTDMTNLLTALFNKNKDFKFKTTNDENEVVKHLKSGGMAIANQGDEYNVFSTNGHFVVLSKMNGNNIEVLDPQMYDGKYDAYSRPKRIVKKTATGCIVSKAELAKATQDRSPAYFLITYTKPKEVKPMPKYPYFTPNATVKAKTKVYADNNRKTQVGSVSKNERVKALFIGPTNACIQYKVTDTVYKVGLIYSKNVKKDKK